MVYYFDCQDPQFTVYMGRDKFENEDLIRHAWPEDVWFHVDQLSSAHVYLRCPPETNWTELPANVLNEMAQLVKNNSIEGCKKDSVDVVYTPATNLKKSGNMAIGQVGFHDQQNVRYLRRVQRERDIVKRIEKTSREVVVDLEKEKFARDRREIQKRKQLLSEQRAAEKAERERRAEERATKSYASLYENPSAVIETNEVNELS